MPKRAALGLMLGLVSGSSVAGDTAEQQVHAFLHHHIETALNEQFSAFENLNIRYRISAAIQSLPSCQKPLVSEKVRQSVLGSQSWWVECGDRWRVKALTQTSIDTKLVVTRHGLKKGQRISSDDIELARQTLALDSPVYQSLERVVGTKLRRSMREKQAVTARHIALEHMVNKGHQVSIVYQGSSFSLETTGIAMSDGMQGDRIMVRNLESGKVLSVEVVGDHRVRQP